MTGLLVTLAVGLALGAAVSVPALDAVLSSFFAVALPVGGGLALLGWAAREVWDLLRDWQVMGPPDWWLRRAKRADDREEAEQQ